MENRNCEIARGRSPHLFKVLQNDTGCSFEVRRVERCRYWQGTVCETNLPLHKKNTILVQSGWSFDLPQAKVEVVGSLGRAGSHKAPHLINQGDVNMPILK